MTASLPISETFTSIQGEGKLTGVPSLFIRLSGCNLRCRWCDTPYASWAPESTARSIDDLVHLARQQHSRNVRHAVLTGGEPMMFPGLTELSARLAEFMHITIETAGTVIPDGGVDCHLMSISPKLASSTPRNDPRDPSGAWAARHEERRLNIPTLQRLIDEHAGSAETRRDVQLKFVASPPPALEADLEEIESVLSRLHGWRPDDVLLMPEGVAPPTAGHRAAVAAACQARGWRYCGRLHIELFGNTRGT